MSPGRPPGDQFGDGDFEDEGPRSVFASAWFRALLVVAALGVIGVLALPYLLEWVGPAVGGRTVNAPVLTMPSPPAQPEAPSPPSAVPDSAPPTPTASPPTPAQASRPDPVPATPIESEPKKARAEETQSAGDEEPKAERPRAARATRAKPSRATPRPSRAPVVASGGVYFVQVGAFRDERLAKALGEKLRAENFPVVELGPHYGAPSEARIPEPPVGASDRYDVFVAGASSADVNAKLSSEGLAADPVAGGALIKPSLPLRDAVTLSKDLANSGFKVQVRRATGDAGAEPASPRAAPVGGDGLYRVRVGGFPDRAAAEEARKALAAKGYGGFIARSGG